MKQKKKMLLAMQLNNGYGSEPGAWRLPAADPKAYTNMDYYVNLAKTAERGKIQMIFLADTPALKVDIRYNPPQYAIDPLITLTAIARETEKIGLVLTMSTTFNHPYNVARQLKALDVISNGRVGWNAVTTSTPEAAANFGAAIASRTERYELAHEFIEIVQALWGSWAEDAWLADKENGLFADMKKIKPINTAGKYLSSRGPLPIPPSEQGQPVIFQAGGGDEGLKIAAMYASGVYANPFDIPSARFHRDTLQESAVYYKRKPSDINLMVGFMPSIASTEREALDRRQYFDFNVDLPQRVSYLGMLVGLPLSMSNIDEPVPKDWRQMASANSGDPRSVRAVELVLKGWTVRDIIAHGVINYHPVIAGTPEQVADFMEKWFIAGACDGFSIVPDSTVDAVDHFVDYVIPILQKRGHYHEEYEGSTLREHMGVSYQYGSVHTSEK